MALMGSWVFAWHIVGLRCNLLTIHIVAEVGDSIASCINHCYSHVESSRLRTGRATILDVSATNVGKRHIRLRQILSVKNLNVGIGEDRAYQQTGYCTNTIQ